MDNPTIAGSLSLVAIVATNVFNHVKGKRRDRGRVGELDGFERRLTKAIDEVKDDVSEVKSGVAEVRAFCVGPDGQNGFRSEIRKLQSDVDELQRQERQHLEEKAGGYDRRRAI